MPQITPFKGTNFSELADIHLAKQDRARQDELQSLALRRDDEDRQFRRMSADRTYKLAAQNAGISAQQAQQEAITATLKDIQGLDLPTAEAGRAAFVARLGQFVGDPQHAQEIAQQLPDPFFQPGREDEIAKISKGASLPIRTPSGGFGIATNVVDSRTGDSRISLAELESGSAFVLPGGETPTEKSGRLIGEARGKKSAEKEVGRLGDAILEGQIAADSTATIRRGLQLLKEVQTGGLNEIRIKALQAFGVESPEEGEISNLLGKAVLSQLTSTFGAAFTEGEGNRLISIEASLGKKADTNEALLNNALQLAERAAKRGLEAAIQEGDELAIKQIQEALEFTLGEDAPSQGNFSILSVEDE